MGYANDSIEICVWFHLFYTFSNCLYKFCSLSVSTTFSNWSLQKIIFVYIYVFLTIYLYKFSSVS